MGRLIHSCRWWTGRVRYWFGIGFRLLLLLFGASWVVVVAMSIGGTVTLTVPGLVAMVGGLVVVARSAAGQRHARRTT